MILAVSHHKAWLIVGLGASFKTLRQTHYIELYIICVYIDGCWSLKECGYPWLYIFFFLVQDNVNPVLAMVLQPRMVYGSIGATENGHQTM